MVAAATEISPVYDAFKTDLTDLFGITRDALHVHVGLALFFVAVVLLRKSPASLVPWLCVLGVEVANELKDMFHFGRTMIYFDLGDSPKDLVNTMIWPTVLLVWFRIAEHRKRKPATGLEGEGAR